MTCFLVSYIAMVIWSINTSFTNFWCLSQLVTIGTLEAIQIRSTSMNNWHDFFLLNPDIFTFSTEESSFHTTYFGQLKNPHHMSPCKFIDKDLSLHQQFNCANFCLLLKSPQINSLTGTLHDIEVLHNSQKSCNIFPYEDVVLSIFFKNSHSFFFFFLKRPYFL